MEKISFIEGKFKSYSAYNDYRMTSIQISNKIKKELLGLMENFQKISGKRLTYEDVIRRLIDEFKFRMNDRINFSNKYYGSLEGKDVSSQLWESKKLERY